MSGPVAGDVLAALAPDFVTVVTFADDEVPGAFLHPEEEALLPPRVLSRRRRGFTLGRTAARRALLDIGVDAGPILIGQHREPLWPDGVVGSISHAAGVVTAAVAMSTRCGGLGVDIEHRGRYFPELVDYIAFDDERDALRSSPDVAVATLELFSAKESVYKAFFPRVGRYFGFAAARVNTVDGQMTARLVKPLDPRYPPDREIPVSVGWAGGLTLTVVALEPD